MIVKSKNFLSQTLRLFLGCPHQSPSCPALALKRPPRRMVACSLHSHALTGFRRRRQRRRGLLSGRGGGTGGRSLAGHGPGDAALPASLTIGGLAPPGRGLLSLLSFLRCSFWLVLFLGIFSENKGDLKVYIKNVITLKFFK